MEELILDQRQAIGDPTMEQIILFNVFMRKLALEWFLLIMHHVVVAQQDTKVFYVLIVSLGSQEQVTMNVHNAQTMFGMYSA